MTLNSYYQFQIPETEITTYFALRPFNNVESLRLVLVRFCCLCLSLLVLACLCLVVVMFSLFLIYYCCSSYEIILSLPPLSYPKKELSFFPLFTMFSSNNGGTEQH